MDLVPRQPVKLSILSSPAHLPIVRATLEKMCLMLGFSAKVTGAVVLSVDEALTNVIRHAYDGHIDKPIDVDLDPVCAEEPQGLRISLTDWGKQVDPATIKSRDLDDVRPGGLGVHIITECMDEVEYHPRPEGGTLLTMLKNIPAEEPRDIEEVAT